MFECESRWQYWTSLWTLSIVLKIEKNKENPNRTGAYRTHCITLVSMDTLFSGISFKINENMAYQNVITLKFTFKSTRPAGFSLVRLPSSSTICILFLPVRHSFNIALWLWCLVSCPHQHQRRGSSLCSPILDYLFIAWSSTVHFGVRIVKYFRIECKRIEITTEKYK